MNKRNIILLSIVLIIIVGIIYFLESQKVRPTSNSEDSSVTIIEKTEKQKTYDVAKEISSPDGFINTDGITINELIGKKVILVDFWTYSCINCQRTTPFLNAWHEKYKDLGLVIIGIHTPEFEFEKEYANVVRAVEKFKIKYPVVLDNDFSTWRAYKNRYWPRKYLIDIDGFIVYDHIGEGAYDKTEQKIQELLEERMTVLSITGELDKDMIKSEVVEEVDRSKPQSPEIYFGAARNRNFGNGRTNTRGVQSLSEPDDIQSNTFYLIGDWEFTDEYAENKSENAKIIFKYQASKVFFVASSDNGVSIEIKRNGKTLGKEAGKDVNNSNTVIQEDGLYRLIEDPAGYGAYTLEIIIKEPGLKAFTFTFG